jgi:hypothetical protein
MKESHSDNQWNKVASTEVINNNLNPDFQKTFKVKYFFEKSQHIKFLVVDDDGHG